MPAAYFPSSATCNFATHLGSFNIVIDLDFCMWLLSDLGPRYMVFTTSLSLPS